MTLNEFIIKWQGKEIDFDGWYGTQCLDLMHQYVVNVLGLVDGRILAAPAAKDVYNNYENIFGHELFERIANTLTGVPQEGDIVFFSSGTYGHVCIFIEGDANKFRSFDANWPVGTLPHIQEHTYGYCLGWLRYKGGSTSVSIDGKVFENLVRKSTICDKVAEKLNVEESETVILAEIDKLIAYEDAIVQKDRQLQDSMSKTATLEQQLKELQDKHETLRIASDMLQQKFDEQVEVITKQGQEIKSLSTAITELKNANQEPVLRGWKKWIYDLIVRV